MNSNSNSNSIFKINQSKNNIIELSSKSIKNRKRNISVRIISRIKLEKQKKEKNENLENNNISQKAYYLNDTEMNSLIYNEALKYDKRTYFQYYLSLIRTKHMLFFAFYSNKDYNSQIIKISLFLFSFNLYDTTNALFFTDDTIHQIYQNSGKFDFIYQLPHILYSTIISAIINLLIKFLSLSEKIIIQLKNELNEKNYKIIIPKKIKCLKIKFILFYILSFIFLIFFWFYLSCFCAVYKNTQMHIIEDTLISFGLSLLYPFGLYLLPGFLRIPSLKAINKDKKSLYEISQIIQLI